MDQVTTAGAGAALVSPWWLPTITTSYQIADALHSTAAWLLPFMGVAWLAMQMYYKARNERGN